MGILSGVNGMVSRLSRVTASTRQTVNKGLMPAHVRPEITSIAREQDEQHRLVRELFSLVSKKNHETVKLQGEVQRQHVVDNIVRVMEYLSSIAKEFRRISGLLHDLSGFFRRDYQATKRDFQRAIKQLKKARNELAKVSVRASAVKNALGAVWSLEGKKAADALSQAQNEIEELNKLIASLENGMKKNDYTIHANMEKLFHDMWSRLTRIFQDLFALEMREKKTAFELKSETGAIISTTHEMVNLVAQLIDSFVREAEHLKNFGHPGLGRAEEHFSAASRALRGSLKNVK